jgi:hypothetical protein
MLTLSLVQLTFLVISGKLSILFISIGICELASFLIYYLTPTRLFPYLINGVVYFWILLIIHLFECINSLEKTPLQSSNVRSSLSTNQNSSQQHSQISLLPLKLNYLFTFILLHLIDIHLRTIHFAEWYKLGAHTVGYTPLLIPLYVGLFDEINPNLNPNPLTSTQNQKNTKSTNQKDHIHQTEEEHHTTTATTAAKESLSHTYTNNVARQMNTKRKRKKKRRIENSHKSRTQNSTNTIPTNSIK